MTKTLNVGMIGYGFMGRAHSNAYRRVTNFSSSSTGRCCKAVRARNAEKVKRSPRTGDTNGSRPTGESLSGRKDIDLIDIGAPNHMHYEIALAAAKAGKMVLCEKPLAMNVKQAEAMAKAVEKARVPNMVWYNYRRVPAIALAKQMVDEGRIGRPFHYRATYPARLDDRAGRAPGRRCPVAARRGTWPARASPATCSPIRSTPRCG